MEEITIINSKTLTPLIGKRVRLFMENSMTNMIVIIEEISKRTREVNIQSDWIHYSKIAKIEVLE